MSESEMRGYKELLDKFTVWEKRLNTPYENELVECFAKDNLHARELDRYAFIAFLGGYFLGKSEAGRKRREA
jgi:hypothetical protein